MARYNSGAGAEEVLQRSFFSSRRVYRSRSFHDQLLNTLPRSWFPLDCIFGSFPKRQFLQDVKFILIQHKDKPHLFSNILEGFKLDKADYQDERLLKYKIGKCHLAWFFMIVLEHRDG